MDKRQNPIAVFDSGAGGISVLKELVHLMPGENYIYYGDSLNAPYGTKPTEEVRRLTLENAAMLIEEGAKEVVIACNTATSAAIANLREMYPSVPMIGLEPAIKPAALECKGGKVLVMATELTLREKKFLCLLEKYKDTAEIISLPCPELVEFAENGITEGKELDNYLNSILAPYTDTVKGIVLGCTHFPLLRNAIQKAAGKIKLYDGGIGAAKEALHRLNETGLINDASCGSIVFKSSLKGKEELYKKLFYNQ